MGGDSTFDHGVDGFDLPALTVAPVVFGQPLLHLSAVTAGRQLRGRAPMQRRGVGTHSAYFAGMAMIGFGIGASVSQNRGQKNAIQRPIEQGAKTVDVKPRTPPGGGSPDEMGGTGG